MVAVSVVRLHAAQSTASPFKVGDVAPSNIVASARITVVNPQAADSAKIQAELGRVQPFYRFYVGAAADAEKEFRAAFASARESFLKALEAEYGDRVLSASQLSRTKFRDLVAGHWETSGGMPCSTNIAREWALGDSGLYVADELASRLRTAMTRVIRADVLAEPARPTGAEIRLVPASAGYVAKGLDAALQDARPYFWTNIVTVSDARRSLEQMFTGIDQPNGRFLARFIRDNCQFDAAVTREARDRIAAGFWTSDTYEPGQAIVRAGQRVEARQKLALDELSARLETERRLAESAEARLRSEAETRRIQMELIHATEKAKEDKQSMLWTVSGIAAVVLLGGGVWFWQARRVASRRRALGRMVLRPAKPAGPVLPADPALRASLMPHLAQWLSLGLFQRLLSQRSSMIDHQKQAEQEMARFEERLMRLQAPLHDRLRAYEQRISELERQLDTKAEENRELIRAVIATTRRKLEAERSNSLK